MSQSLVVVPTELQAKVLQRIHIGCTVRDAVLNAGVSLQSLQRWETLSRDATQSQLRDFFRTCEMAKAQVRCRLVEHLYKIATGTSEVEPRQQAQQIKAINRLLSTLDRETWCPSFGDGYKRATVEILNKVRKVVPKEQYRKVLEEVAG